MVDPNFRNPRIYDPGYLDWIRQQPCCICGNTVATEAHHPRVGSVNHDKPYTGMAEKASDRWAVAVCGKHHRELHAMSEMEFWASYHIDPFALAMNYRGPG